MRVIQSLFWPLLAAFGVRAAWPSIPGFERPARSFVLLGDSTTKCDGGWGPGFCSATLNITTITCINFAVSGGTTGWFFDSGLFRTALAAIGAEASSGHRPIVTVQYGHNDQKFAPPESMARNLTTIVKNIRAVGGEPVLLTSLTRRNFNGDGTIQDALAEWAAATVKVARSNKVPLVDLHAKSIEYCESIGPDASHRLGYAPNDNTHLNPNGATVFGRLVADLLLAALGNDASVPIKPDPELSYNITHGIPSF